MRCLSCGNPSSVDSVLCSECSSSMEADFVGVLDRASKQTIEANQLEVTKEGILILVSDNSVTYMVLSQDQWDILGQYLSSVKFERMEDEN